MPRLIHSLLLLCLLLTTAPTPLNAATIELPLTLRTQILQNALAESLAPQPDRPTVLFQQDSYNYLHISKPQLSIREGQPYFSCNASASMGFESLGILPSVVKWNGSILMRLDFYVDPQWQLRYRILDSAIYNEKGGKPVVSGFAWDLSKRFLHPRLEKYGFDLAMPQKDITALLRACASATDTAPLEAALSTLTVGTLRANADGLTVPLLLTVNDSLTQPPPLPPQAPLGFEELEKLQHVFEPLDAFLVFIIKSLSTDMVDSSQQEKLFNLLITSRYQLLMILTGQTPMEKEDPLRLLFIDAWDQLRPIVEENSGKNGLMQKQLLRYMTFISAGDALLTLDKTAPGLGIHLTSDGLRRLARMLQPGSGEDPLRFDWQLDPALRDLFHFQPEEPEPKIQIPVPDVPPPTTLPTTAPADPRPDFPPDEPPPSTPQDLQQGSPQSFNPGRHLLDFLVGVAHAEEPPPMNPAELKKRLANWVPKAEELDEYGKIIGQLLKSLASEQVKHANLEPRFATIYQHLVPATAMIESCWQQFVLKDDKVITLKSQAGGIGIMQINQHVWRGFYDMERLQRDVAYNIQAGNQILMRYFQQYGTQVAKENGKPDHAARAAYAAYNAGPRAIRRFMNPDANARQKRVDDHLWELYQKLAAGGRADLANCNIM